MKKFLLIFLAALMLFAVGCGDSNNDGPKAPFTAATYEVGGVLTGYDPDATGINEITFLTENTYEFTRHIETFVLTVEDLIDAFDIPADKIDFTADHTFTRIAHIQGSYTKDGNNYTMTSTGQIAMSFKLEGEVADKVKNLILDAMKEINEETYKMFKDAFESRYEVDNDEDQLIAEMKVSLVDGKILFNEVKEYEEDELSSYVQFNNGIINKVTYYLDGRVDIVTDYNDVGCEILETRYNEDGSEESKATYEYDDDNNLIREMYYEGDRLIEKYEYDAEGNCTLEEHYDENGNLIPDEEPEDETETDE